MNTSNEHLSIFENGLPPSEAERLLWQELGKPEADPDLAATLFEQVCAAQEDRAFLWRLRIVTAAIWGSGASVASAHILELMAERGLVLESQEHGVAVLGLVIDAQRWSLAPSLVRLGMVYDGSVERGKQMAAALGRGLWTHPDLVAPQLFEGGWAVGELAQKLFERNGNGLSKGLASDHIEKLSRLSYGEDACGLITGRLLSSMRFSIQLASLCKALAPPVLGRMMKADMVDAGAVQEGLSQHGAVATWAKCVSDAEQWLLDQHTAEAQAPGTGRHRRL